MLGSYVVLAIPYSGLFLKEFASKIPMYSLAAYQMNAYVNFFLP